MQCGDSRCDRMTVGRGNEMSTLDVAVIAASANFVIGIICFCLEENSVVKDGYTVSRVIQDIFNLVLLGWYVSVDMGWI